MKEGLKQFFKVAGTCGEARAGVIETVHGKIKTPVFMPVGTRASVKSLRQESLEELGAQIILGNTYHLHLRPGDELIDKVTNGGGLHQFMNWQRPILTDSGGYQVFSLSNLRKITEEGVHLRSHIDGAPIFLTPEKSMEIQRNLGADIVMIFDECPALPASFETLEKSVERTLRWAKRCQKVPLKDHQHLFGIVQGGLDYRLRQRSLEGLCDLGFSGYALGGLSVGEKNDEMVSFCREFVPQMPQSSPRYLMGVGTPLDILNGVRAGLDMFDCVLPTRNARNGQFLTTHGPLSIKKACFAEDTLPPDPHCSCSVCQRYTRTYIRHLYLCGEMTAAQLITYHNLYFYFNMMNNSRATILSGEFDEYYRNFYNNYTSGQWN